MQSSESVEMISVCGTDGALQPLRFRYGDPAGGVQVAHVLEVLSRQEVRYIHAEAYLFTCRARVGEQEQLLQVRYSIRTHRWYLFHRIC